MLPLIITLSTLFLSVSPFISLINFYQYNQRNGTLVNCDDIPNLSNRQKLICYNHEASFIDILQGIVKSKNQCSKLFENDVWNCKGHDDSNIFGFDVKKLQIKEKAFVYAYAAAAATISVAKGCSRGNNPRCDCGKLPENEINMEEKYGFTWNGCSDNIKYANNIVRNFFEEQKKDNNNDLESMMDSHNFMIGRLKARKSFKKVCKCHGISGSCQTKTCWMATSSIEEIGKDLKYLMESARIVRTLNTRSIDTRSGSLSSSRNLVYLNPFNDFCTKNDTLGISGIKGRECFTKDQCNNICCGRGFTTHMELIEEQCNCKFEYCCQVKCKLCKKIITRYHCK
uniref:Protein Wnt n=1 Tax=Strongyloides papillosus TaxID=174720 RepID=A0A0N5B937_STREA